MGKKKPLTAADQKLLDEANRINYRLRSTYFYRKLKEYNTLLFAGIVANLLSVKDLYDWRDRKDWGIGEDEFAYISSHGELHPMQVFCHPKLLREHPRLLAYYRHIAALPQKGVKNLVHIDVKKVEADTENRIQLSERRALGLAKLFNEHVTLILQASIQTLTQEELYGILLTSTGSQIDGSWRNKIGEEAESVVKRLLIEEAKGKGILKAFIGRVGSAVEEYDEAQDKEQLGQFQKYRGVLLSNKTSILFASEPDISFLDMSGKTTCVVEVKGGTDKAGALERYGAAKKSFEEARRQNPHVQTIFVASCITPEVEERIKGDPTVTFRYNLTEILNDETNTRRSFMERVFSFLEDGNEQHEDEH